jgi:hypothetical protein
VTYSNACFAAMMGTSVKLQGTCEATCFSNAECGAGFCRKAAGACGALGVCQPKPDVCNQLVEPVCGCDGATYSNGCFAALAGVNASAAGECL